MTTERSVPLSERITIALGELRAARARGDRDRVETWQLMLDRMLDKWAKGHR